MHIFGPQHESPITTAASFRDLYERDRMPVFRYLYGLTGGPEDLVEDLAAETFLRAWRARHRYDGSLDSAIRWLLRIAKRLAIDNYRRRAVQTAHIDLFPVTAESEPEQSAIAREQQRLLLQLLDGLPDEHRELLVLRYVLGWRVNEIADHIGTTENHVSVTIHRTLSKLREAWSMADDENMATVFADKEKIS